MSKILFPSFLKDPIEYHHAESAWLQAWNLILGDIGQIDIWQTPWINTSANDGTPLRDGNPIFSAVCPYRLLGIRVIQLAPEDGDANELSAWTDTFGEGDSDAIKELVIDCVLSDEALRKADALIRSWITQEIAGEIRRAS